MRWHTCGSALGPWKSSGSLDRLLNATWPGDVSRRESVKSISVTATPFVWQVISTPLQGSATDVSPGRQPLNAFGWHLEQSCLLCRHWTMASELLHDDVSPKAARTRQDVLFKCLAK